MATNGTQFLEALKRLDYPGVDKLDANSFDWLFDDDRLLSMLEWFCDNIQSSNVIPPGDLEEYAECVITI